MRKLRISSFVALHGKLPTHIPKSERFDSGVGADPSIVDSCVVVTVFGVDSEGVGKLEFLVFLAFRRAFLDGGSGAETSTSISAAGLFSLFRFRDGDTGGVRVVNVIVVECLPIATNGSTLLKAFLPRDQVPLQTQEFGVGKLFDVGVRQKVGPSCWCENSSGVMPRGGLSQGLTP